MTFLRIACLQLCSGRDPRRNLQDLEALFYQATEQNPHYIQTPEMTNIVECEGAALRRAAVYEERDPFLERCCALAQEKGVWLHLGSLAVLVEKETGEEVVNRGYMIAPNGIIQARYDKIHQFDAILPNGDIWHESALYQAGTQLGYAVLPWCPVGLAICYDLRFPTLFRLQALAGAFVLTAPACFTQETGKAHWHILQRARAIENAAFMISAAQGGIHEDGRHSYGHSLVVDPWGRIVQELEHAEPGFLLAEIDLTEVEQARAAIPVLHHEKLCRSFTSSFLQKA